MYLGLVLITGILIVPTGFPLGKIGTSPIGTGIGAGGAALIWGPRSTHIQHVVTVVMENRPYDNYFGSYCEVAGPFCSYAANGIPPGTCVPLQPTNTSMGCSKPYPFNTSEFITPDMPHNWVSGLTAWDNGAMDGFFNAEAQTNETFGYYNGSTIPIYWDLAEEYAISDNLFAGNLSYSLPNHWDLVAGKAPAVAYGSYIDTQSSRTTYLYQAQRTRTIEDLLNNSTVSWKYYDYPLGNYTISTQFNGAAYDYWNPLASKAESYSTAYIQHFAPRLQFLTDAANGSLPALSWVIPAANQSDHPGFNVSAGESWVAQLVDAVEKSPDWNSTVIFVIWDDYGGWYDHVAPPHLYGNLLSFRSPILVISPYAKENYVSHVPLDFFSLLRYTEWQFGLGCITGLDCTAALPFDFFDFNQTARAPIVFPTLWNQAVYPMSLQRGSSLMLPVCLQCDIDFPQNWSGPDLQISDSGLGD